MFNAWFGKDDTTDFRPRGSEKSDNEQFHSTERDENTKRLPDSGQTVGSLKSNIHKPITPPHPPTFEEIYDTATVKPPKIAYGILKVVEMGNSSHLVGMSPAFKQKALMMAIEATGADVGELLDDEVTRQRALKEYEERYMEKVNQFEAAQIDQNRLLKAELEKITSQYKARIDASLGEVKCWQHGFREWQKSKQQEQQRLTDAVALFVPQEPAEEDASTGNVMPIAQRVGSAYR
jgi:hypothetical protein